MESACFFVLQQVMLDSQAQTMAKVAISIMICITIIAFYNQI